jgi:isoleucyl-tRNA synthetase
VAVRIVLRWDGVEPGVVAALSEHSGLIADEVLATEFVRGEADGTFGDPFTEDSLTLTFRLRKA